MSNLRLGGPLTTLGLLILWSAGSALASSPLFLPSPAQVFHSFWDTYPEILLHTGATLGRALTGLAIGSTVGFFIGLFMSWNQLSFSILDPLIEGIRPVPAVAAIPFFILWLGTGDGAQVILITVSCAAIIAVDVYQAVANVSPFLVHAAQSLGAGRIAVYRTVIIPAILPHLTGGLRIVAALSFTIEIASEFMGAQWGLGFIIMRARRSMETHTILLAIILVAALARMTDLAIRKIINRITRWSELSSDALGHNSRKEPPYATHSA